MQKPSLAARAAKCMAAWALVASAMVAVDLTSGRKTLAAQTAAGHQSVTAVVVIGGAVVALLLGAMSFLAASAASWARSAWRERARARAAQDAGTGESR